MSDRPSEERVRVALVVDSDAFGGAEVYARQLLRRAAHEVPGVEPVALVAAPVAAHFGERDVRVTGLHRHREEAPELAAELAALEPDVVHVNLVDPASNRAALRAALEVAPTTATLHLQGDPGPDPAGLRAVLGRLAAALAPSATIAAQLRDLGVRDVHRVRNGVDLPAAPATPRDARPLRLGAVGRLTDQKGFDLLLDAVEKVDPDGRRMHLTIAGAGRDRDALLRRADGLPVTFTGHCADIQGFLAGLDAFVLPSRREALSLALLEAMGAGLPCLTTDVGDHAEAVGDDALVVPPDDVAALTAALDRLLDDAGLRAAPAPRARARALRDFGADRMVRQSAQVLAAVARTARTARATARG